MLSSLFTWISKAVENAVIAGVQSAVTKLADGTAPLVLPPLPSQPVVELPALPEPGQPAADAADVLGTDQPFDRPVRGRRVKAATNGDV